MLISAMQHSPNPAAHFSLMFHYFDGNSPLLSFLKFHEEFVLRNDCEESKKYLKEFQLNMDKVLLLARTQISVFSFMLESLGLINKGEGVYL